MFFKQNDVFWATFSKRDVNFFPLLRNPRISYRHHYNKTKLLMGYVLLGKCAIWWEQNWQKYIHTVDVILYLTGPTKSFYIVHGHYIGYNMDISSQNFRLIRQKFVKMKDRPLSTHTYIFFFLLSGTFELLNTYIHVYTCAHLVGFADVTTISRDQYRTNIIFDFKPYVFIKAISLCSFLTSLLGRHFMRIYDWYGDQPLTTTRCWSS